MKPSKSQPDPAASERRFACSHCGKCCFGALPLTLADALASAGRFPLAMIWTAVRQTSRAFDLTARLGATVRLPNRKHVAVLISPASYLPPSFACPVLTPDKLCGIHSDKPLRCQAMPFYAYRNEDDQLDVLTKREGWGCIDSEIAPVVYRNKKIVDRMSFDREREALIAQAPVLRTYADLMLKQNPSLMALLAKAALSPFEQPFVVSFYSFLRQNKKYDLVEFARAQHPVLTEFHRRTAETPLLTEYHKYYQESAAQLAWFAQRSYRT